MMAPHHSTSRLISPSHDYVPYRGWNMEGRGAPTGPSWSTTSQYADGILTMSGRPRATTDVAGELQSLLAMVRRAVISMRRDQAEQQIARLEAMRGEAPGWDGRNAGSPDEQTIDLAVSLLRRLADAGLPIPTATMSPSGNAALFAHGRGVYADIELHADKTVSWLIQLPAGPEIEATEPYDGKMNAIRLISILKHAAGAIA
jgi:hypothetical protein